MTDQAAERVSAQRCLELLHEVAPVPPRLVELLDLPGELIRLDAGELSLSSEPCAGLADVVAALSACRPVPMEFCAYGIHLTRRGSNVFCTVADRRRRIIVMHSVGNTLSDYHSWDSFVGAMENAEAIATALRAQGEPFDFVVHRESGIQILRPSR